MKRTGNVKVCVVLAILVILGVGGVAEADYLIILRSGKEIKVRRYEEQGDKIVYKRYGGKISIPKAHVATIKDLSRVGKQPPDRPSTAREPRPTLPETLPPAHASPPQPRHSPQEAVPPKTRMEAFRRLTPSRWKRCLYAGFDATMRGRHAEAEAKYLAALREAEKYGPESDTVAVCLSSLARVYYAQQKYSQAEQAYARALPIMERLMPEHPMLGGSLYTLGLVYVTQGKYPEAEKVLRRAVVLQEKARPMTEDLMPGSPFVGLPLQSLGGVYLAQRKYAEAEKVLTRAFVLQKKVLGPEHPIVTTSLFMLEAVYTEQGKDAEAAQLHKKALAILEKGLRTSHPKLLLSLNNLAVNHMVQKNYAAAEPVLKLALEIAEKSLGPNDPRVANVLWNMAGLYKETGRNDERKRVLERAHAICNPRMSYWCKRKATP